MSNIIDSSDIRYTIVGEPGTVTAFVLGHPKVLIAKHDHPNFEIITKILDSLDVGYEIEMDGFIDLFDVEDTIRRRFAELSERVTVGDGTVYFDGEAIHNALTAQILRVMDEGGDFQSLVNFMEKLMDNPDAHSREQFYPWIATSIEREQFTILPNGNFLGYKGVQKDGKGGYESIRSGPGIVNGESMVGNLPNNIGDVVEMARSRVYNDPSVGCAQGLHVGTFDYATGWGHGLVLGVEVNPAHVVSVPTDCDAQKIRCERYKVIDVREVACSKAQIDLYESDEDDEFEGSFADFCGFLPEYL